MARPDNTARLAFSEITPADLDDLAALFGDPRVMEHDPPPLSRAETLEWIEWNQEMYADPGFGLWAVRLLETGEFVGECGLTLQEVGGEVAIEIEFHVRVELQGYGYATEAAVACRDFAATALGLRRLIGIILPGNTVTQHVVEKLGFHREGDVVHEGAAAVLYSVDPVAAYRSV